MTSYYFVRGIPRNTLRPIFHRITAGKLIVRYRVESSPAAPPTIAIIIIPIFIVVTNLSKVFM